MPKNTPYEQRVELDKTILWLNNKEEGSLFTPYCLQKDTGLHGQTARRVLEAIYMCQQFAPHIEINFRPHKMEVRIDEIAPYVRAMSLPKRLVLTKLYLAHAFDKRNAKSNDLLSVPEKALVEQLVRERMVKSEEGCCYLTPAGFSEAVQSLEVVAKVRDECLLDLKRGIRRKKALEAEALTEKRALDKFIEAVYSTQEGIDRLVAAGSERLQTEPELNEKARQVILQWSTVEKELSDLSVGVLRIREELDKLGPVKEPAIPEADARRRSIRLGGT
jgi:hypothetical protein